MRKELHDLIVGQQRFLVLLMLHKLVFLNAKRKTYANKVVYKEKLCIVNLKTYNLLFFFVLILLMFYLVQH